ncbi:MAG: hypothetical protein H7Y86_01685 [Rhizobacter sp.]|nr:hypothetical protein [Ferruginibacter sp.]
MAILVSSKVKGQTTEGYDGVLMMVKDAVKKAPGFIMHFAFPVAEEDFWQVYEVWQSKAEADIFFAKYIAPNLPKGVYPKRTYHELHSLVDISSLPEKKSLNY